MTRKYFGTDGIRGVAGEGALSADAVRSYGQAVGLWLRARIGSGKVLVGRDTRASGPALLEQLADGLIHAGHEVVDAGVIATPGVQALCVDERFSLAIVISASHNPARDNGLKFFGPDGRKLPDAAEMELEAQIEALQEGAPFVADPEPGRLVADRELRDRYVHGLIEGFDGLDLRGMTVVLDAAHGAAAAYGAQVLEALGATVHARGVSPDGTNINDGAGVFATDALGDAVRSHGADLGIALDGDADRVLLVDHEGSLRDGDHILGVLAVDLARRGLLEGEQVVATLMANLGLGAWLRQHAIELHQVPVGDRHVAARMSESGAVLGGEQSGHVIFHEDGRWYGDGLYAALRVLEVMRREKASLAELSRGIEKYPQVLINVPVQSKPPFEEVPELESARERAASDMGDDGRIVLRYSGTESLLRVMVEGKDLPVVQSVAESLAALAQGELG